MDKPKRSEYINTVPKRSAKTPFHPVNFAFTTPLSLEESKLRLQDLGASKKFLKVFTVGSDIRVELNEINSDYVTFRIYKNGYRSPDIEAKGELKRWEGVSTLVIGTAFSKINFVHLLPPFASLIFALVILIANLQSRDYWAIPLALILDTVILAMGFSPLAFHRELTHIIENALVPLQRKRKEK